MTPMTRRSFVVISALSLRAAFAAAQPSSSSRTLRIGYQLSSTLTTILKSNGKLEQALAPLGVEVTWHEFTSGLPLLEALNTGNIDFSADVADTVPIFAIAAGAKLAYVAEEAPSPHAQAIVVPSHSSIKTLAELKGKRIAVTKAAGSHYLLIAALNSVNLTFKDISPAYLAPADGRAAFVSDNVDAWVAWDPYLTAAERQNAARVLADGEGLANYKRYYLASQSYAQARSDVLKIVFDQLSATGKWVKSRPDDAAALLAGIWHIDRDIVKEANAHRSYAVGPVTKQGLSEQKKIAAAFFAQGLLPREIDGTEADIWQP
jgi:sulfonate transport system substrate-binding protein